MKYIIKKKIVILVFLVFPVNVIFGIIAPQEFFFERASRNAQITSLHSPTYILTPLTITEPGVYALLDNSILEPSANGETGILINADDVLLDLNLKSISQKEDNLFVDIDGIKIAPSKKNIIIRNGAINNIKGSAIHIQDGVEIVDMYDLTISNPATIGIFFDGLSTGTGIKNIAISSSIIQGMKGDLSMSVTGIQITKTSIMNIDKVTINSIRSQSADACGICAIDSNSLRIVSSVVGDNTSSGCSGIGFSFINTENIFIKDTLAGRNVCLCPLSTSQALGFKLQNVKNVFFDKCTSASNSATFSSIGYLIEDSSFVLFNGCQAFNNGSSQSTAAGFEISDCTNVICTSCQAGGNTGFVDGHGYFFENCTASAVNESMARLDLGLTGTAYGIRLKNSVGMSIIKNQVAGHQGGQGGFGIFDSFGSLTTNTILSNLAIKNTVNYFPGAPTIPIYTGGLSGTPGPFENISLS